MIGKVNNSEHDVAYLPPMTRLVPEILPAEQAIPLVSTPTTYNREDSLAPVQDQAARKEEVSDDRKS